MLSMGARPITREIMAKGVIDQMATLALLLLVPAGAVAFHASPGMGMAFRHLATRYIPLLPSSRAPLPVGPLLHSSSSPLDFRSSTVLSGAQDIRSVEPERIRPSKADVAAKAAVLFSLCLAVGAVVFHASPALAAASKNAAMSPANMSPLKRALKFVLHLDKELAIIISNYGKATYAILWAIVFAETGLVVTPFLPGDSLLFACGALCALGSLNLGLTCAVFLTAAIIGDAVNYAIGNAVGPKAFEADTFFLKKKNLKKTQEFYAQYGGKTIVLARFVPIVRTFAPFVAGVGSMKYSDFATYNVVGAIVWTVLFVGAGFVFGNIPAVQHNFTLVVLAIVAVSVLPVVWEVIQARKEGSDE